MNKNMICPLKREVAWGILDFGIAATFEDEQFQDLLHLPSAVKFLREQHVARCGGFHIWGYPQMDGL